jgi:riboflavin synthase
VEDRNVEKQDLANRPKGATVFTGLVQSLGQLRLIDSYHLEVICPGSPILSDIAAGDSIAVDGACLTVEAFNHNSFIVTVSPETLERTTLGERGNHGASVNLEAALRVGSKLGGHFVTGHVDGIGRLAELKTSGSSWQLMFLAPPTVAPYIVTKGSIAVNGISLTIADCDATGHWFTVAVIPHSFAQTNLQHLQVGDTVNLESDLLGKYAARLLRPYLGKSDEFEDQRIPAITLDFLAEHGY